MHLSHKLFLLAFTILLSAYFNDVQAQKSSGKSKKSNLTEEQQRNLEKSFIDACSARQLGDMEEAVQLFRKCLSIDKKNHATMFELAKIYREQKNIAEAGEMIEEAVALNPNNKYYTLFYADLLGLVGRFDEAAAVYSRLSEQEPDNMEYQFQQSNI